jgi:hypothetical protein
MVSKMGSVIYVISKPELKCKNMLKQIFILLMFFHITLVSFAQSNCDKLLEGGLYYSLV